MPSCVHCSTSILVLVLLWAALQNAEAAEQFVKHHEQLRADPSEQGDDQSDDDGVPVDNALDDDAGPSNAGALAEGSSEQTPVTTWDQAKNKHSEEGNVQFLSTRPIKVHWLWHQAMCLEADTRKNIHHERNMHLAECRDNPTPSEQRFDYNKDTYQMRLHYDGGKYCLDRDGNNLIFNQCIVAGSAGSQRFVFDASTDHIRNAVGTGGVKCLRVDAGMARHGDLYVNGTNVNLQPCVASETDQKFKVANLLEVPVLNTTMAAAIVATTTVEGGTSSIETSAIERERQRRLDLEHQYWFGHQHAQSQPQPQPQPQANVIVTQPLYYPYMPQPMMPMYQAPPYSALAMQQYGNPLNPMVPAAAQMAPTQPQAAASGGPQAVPPTALPGAHPSSNSSAAQREPIHSKAPNSQVQQSVAQSSTLHAKGKLEPSPSPPPSGIDAASGQIEPASPSPEGQIEPASSSPTSGLETGESSSFIGSTAAGDALLSDSMAADSTSDSLSSINSIAADPVVPGQSMFNDLDHILKDSKALKTPVPESAESQNELSPVLGSTSPQASSSDIDDILSDLNKAGKDMDGMDHPAKSTGSLGDQYADTSFEVGSGALLRRSE
jgi:hypothetical protein